MTRHATARPLLFLAAAGTAYFGIVYLARGVTGTAWAAGHHRRLAGGQALAVPAPPLHALYTTLALGFARVRPQRAA